MVSQSYEQAAVFIAVDARDGITTILDQEGSLTERHKKLLVALCSVLITQAGSFSAIQILDMLSMLIGNLVPKPIETIATGSGLVLLGVAEVTALIELAIRIKLLMDAKAETVSENRVFSALSLLKLITVSAFCLNAFLEQTGTPNSIVAKTADILFVTLIGSEILNDIKMFLSLPSINFWSTTSFVDCILKVFIFCAAMMQLFPKTGALPFGVAGALFAGVAMNVDAAKTQLTHTDTAGVSEQKYLQSDGEGNTIPSYEHSVNLSPEEVADVNTPLKQSNLAHGATLSNNPHSSWTKQVREVASHIGQYVKGEPYSPILQPR